MFKKVEFDFRKTLNPIVTYLASAVTEIKNNPSRHLGNRSWFGARAQGI